jgi:DNA-binding GntR family transcriptional regulator
VSQNWKSSSRHSSRLVRHERFAARSQVQPRLKWASEAKVYEQLRLGLVPGRWVAAESTTEDEENEENVV